MKTQRWKQLIPYFLFYKGDFTLAAIAMIADAALSSLSIWLLKAVIDQVFIEKDIVMLTDLAWIMPTLFLFKGFFSFLLNYRMTKIGHAVARTIRGELMEKLLMLDHSYHSINKSSDLLARMTNDVAAVANMTSNAPLYVIRDGLTVLFLGSTILWLNARFSLFIILTIPIFAGIFILFISKLRKITKLSQELVGMLYGTIAEALNGLTTIKIFLYEKNWLQKFRSQNEAHYRSMLGFQKVTALSPSIMEFLSVLVVTAVLFWGGLDVIRGSWSAGDFMAFLGAAFAVYMPIKHLSQVNPIIQLGLSSWARISALREAPLPGEGEPAKVDSFPQSPIPKGNFRTSHVLSSAPSSQAMLGFHKEICFQKVGLVYPDGRSGMRDVTLTIQKGSRLGIAGPSGSGKTTLAMLMARFYEPTTGQISIDGTDIRSWPISDLRKLLAFVTQESFLFDDTIAANIGVGNPHLGLQAIQEAALLAHASEFIEKLPQKYETQVGERGVRLSGGQKQRVAIARAILKNPQILILDEATSNLDPESEELVLDAIATLLANKTAIIISHRLQTLGAAHRIVVMEAGCIVEETAPGQILNRGEGRLEKLMGL